MTGFLQIITGKQRKTSFEKVNEQKSRPVTYTIASTEMCSRYVLDCSLLLNFVLCCFIFLGTHLCQKKNNFIDFGQVATVTYVILLILSKP